MVHKEYGGEIQIEITKLKDCIVCIIEDNGIGREKAKQLKARRKQTHESAGMNITANRIELLRSIYHKNFSVELIDLFDNTEPTGTRVILKFPVIKINQPNESYHY